MLVRSYLPEQKRSNILGYTPMFHARIFNEVEKYRNTHFQALKPDPNQPKKPKHRQKQPDGSSPDAAEETPAEPRELHLDGNPALDRPLFVQFCANDPAQFLEAAQHAAPYCDAVDLNLGCPQGIARKGHYGAFLQEEPDLIHQLIRTLDEKLPVPVTAKMRVLETPEATLAYAQMILDAGASILTVHGRRREMKGHATGLADWQMIRYLRDNLPKETVLFANGNILQHGDLERCLQATGADGVMTAEGALSDPTIFAAPPDLSDETARREYWLGRDGRGGYRMDAVFRRYMDLLHRYVLEQDPPVRAPLWAPGDPLPADLANPTPTDAAAAAPHKRPAPDAAHPDAPDASKPKLSKNAQKRLAKPPRRKGPGVDSPNFAAMRAHLFTFLRPLIVANTDVRDALARCPGGDLAAFERVVSLVEEVVTAGIVAYERENADVAQQPPVRDEPGQWEDSTEDSTAARERCSRPWWVCQPYVRPLPKEALEKGALRLKKGEAEKAAEEGEKEGEKIAGGEMSSAEVEGQKLAGSNGEREVQKEDGLKEGLVSG
jgi:tRNA-dihydrouridine synthase 1